MGTIESNSTLIEFEKESNIRKESKSSLFVLFQAQLGHVG